MLRKGFCLLLIALFCSGCARQAMLLSLPAGAQVSVDGKQVGFTPCQYEYTLSSGEHYQVELSKPGYRTLETEVVADQSDAPVLKRWLAAGLVWSPLWLGALFTKRLQDEYRFVLEEDPSGLTALNR